MTNCTSGRLSFPACRGRRVEAGFRLVSWSAVTSNGGALLLGQALDRRLGLTAAVARRLGDRASAGQAAPWRGGSAAPEGVRDCPGLRGSERSRCPAPRPCLCRPLPGATGRWPARRRCAVSRTGPSGVGRGRFTRRWWRASCRLREGAGGAGSTSTPPTMRCTVVRRDAFSTAITTAIASCRCMCSPATTLSGEARI